jgi:hypothetical protein
MVSAWFGDLGDGVHTGGPEDPRVELIVVEPEEIRYWKKTQTSVGQLVNVAVSAATGRFAFSSLISDMKDARLTQFCSWSLQARPLTLVISVLLTRANLLRPSKVQKHDQGRDSVFSARKALAAVAASHRTHIL